MMPDQNGPSRAGGATEAKGKIASRRFSGAGREQVAARGQPGALDRATIGKASR